ncbi:MAG: glucosamine-6-phosphate deaminase [Blastopirellula sp.]|nr:MAG: glucosamine-6-phosphate deaminase [Blastopirellula sp.]
MQVIVRETKLESGKEAAQDGAAVIRAALAERGQATIIVATGASQFEVLAALVAEPEIDWSKVTCFHLDEYAGMSIEHPASFRKYLKERFVDQLPTPPAAFHYIDAEVDCQGECDRLGALIQNEQVDVAFIGIGENGHLAFNDPPADFETESPYLVVDLDEACRQQQQGEGWFATLDDVPKQAISMSVNRILKAGLIVCTVPDERKAAAVQKAVEGPVSPKLPASILQQHGSTRLYLDEPAASLLNQ